MAVIMCSIGLLLILVTQFFQLTLIHCKNIEERTGRWYKTYTKTVLETNIVTSTIPASCIQVDPTLLPCRNVRYMNFPQIFAQPQYYDSNGVAEEKSIPSTTPLSWGEYFGIYAPTATVTETILTTTTVQDDRIMVTYSIHGCKPLKLPMDMVKCPEETTNTINILPTTTIFTAFSTTSPNVEEFNEIQEEGFYVESTTKAHLEGTEALP